jgi:hypothetical protein
MLLLGSPGHRSLPQVPYSSPTAGQGFPRRPHSPPTCSSEPTVKVFRENLTHTWLMWKERLWFVSMHDKGEVSRNKLTQVKSELLLGYGEKQTAFLSKSNQKIHS